MILSYIIIRYKFIKRIQKYTYKLLKNNFTIKFDNAIEAVKFVTKVTDAVTGTTMSDRGVKRLKMLLIK